MTDRFEFWTHGADVIVEFTNEYTGHDNGLFLLRTGLGSVIRQNQGTSNWFHFAIPSAKRLDDDFVNYRAAFLRVDINNDAVINLVHVRHAIRARDIPVIYDSGPINVTGQHTELEFNLHNGQCAGPLTVSTRVRFEGENGEVKFVGAGVWFDEWT